MSESEFPLPLENQCVTLEELGVELTISSECSGAANVEPPTSIRKKRRKLFKKDERASIFAKTDGRCYSCGLKMTFTDDWWIEHILPLALGGTDEQPNLLPSCKQCNHIRLDLASEDFRLLLTVGDLMLREMRKGTAIGQQVQALLEKRELKLSKRRKHSHMGLRSQLLPVIPVNLKADQAKAAEKQIVE